jgi:hypothetical protein
MKSTRRTFLMATLSGVGALALSRQALADAPKLPKLEETDSTAQILGYKADAGQVEKAKYPKYAAGQDCSNCAFYQGKPTDAFAPCPMFGGKLVAGKGWCNAYLKKA